MHTVEEVFVACKHSKDNITQIKVTLFKAEYKVNSVVSAKTMYSGSFQCPGDAGVGHWTVY